MAPKIGRKLKFGAGEIDYDKINANQNAVENSRPDVKTVGAPPVAAPVNAPAVARSDAAADADPTVAAIRGNPVAPASGKTEGAASGNATPAWTASEKRAVNAGNRERMGLPAVSSNPSAVQTSTPEKGATEIARMASGRAEARVAGTAPANQNSGVTTGGGSELRPAGFKQAAAANAKLAAPPPGLTGRAGEIAAGRAVGGQRPTGPLANRPSPTGRGPVAEGMKAKAAAPRGLTGEAGGSGQGPKMGPGAQQGRVRLPMSRVKKEAPTSNRVADSMQKPGSAPGLDAPGRPVDVTHMSRAKFSRRGDGSYCFE
jgi:hypothetical protein